MPEPYGEESLAQNQGSDFQYGAPCYDPPPPAGSPEYAGEVPGHPAFTAAARQHDADARQHANAGPAGRGPVGPEEGPEFQWVQMRPIGGDDTPSIPTRRDVY